MSLRERHGEEEKSHLHLDVPSASWNTETLMLAVDSTAIMLKLRTASQQFVWVAGINAFLHIAHQRQLNQVRRVGHSHNSAHTLSFHLKTLLSMSALLLTDIAITVVVLSLLTKGRMEGVTRDLGVAADGVALTSSIWYIIAEYSLSCYQHWSEDEDFKSVNSYRQVAAIVAQTLKLLSYSGLLSLQYRTQLSPSGLTTFSIQTSMHLLYLLWLSVDQARQRHSVQTFIANLPNVKPHMTAEGSDAALCLICRDHLFLVDDDDRPHKSSVKTLNAVKHLPCGHHFHGDCLSAWFHRSFQCPTCRRALGQ